MTLTRMLTTWMMRVFGNSQAQLYADHHPTIHAYKVLTSGSLSGTKG